jgi:hypothetical protein
MKIHELINLLSEARQDADIFIDSEYGEILESMKLEIIRDEEGFHGYLLIPCSVTDVEAKLPFTG